MDQELYFCMSLPASKLFSACKMITSGCDQELKSKQLTYQYYIEIAHYDSGIQPDVSRDVAGMEIPFSVQEWRARQIGL
jgi:hypothetical protein